MWMQNHAVFMKMSPTQCELQADRMPVTKIHTSPLGQSVTLLSPKPEPQSNQSKQNPFNSQESKETRTLFEFVTVEITASTSVISVLLFTVSISVFLFTGFVRKIKLPFVIN